MTAPPQTDKPERIPWRVIEPLGSTESPKNGAFGVLEALRAEWHRRLAALPEEERNAARRRSLRRLAVETGIIERIYDVEWGLTQNLVAEGFTREVVERAGGRMDDKTLATLRAHLDGLELVLDFVRADRELSPGFIKELHQCLLQTQATYAATDALGRTFETELLRGDWKRMPNHVERPDGRLLEYTPPEHVASEIDRLVVLWNNLAHQEEHPLLKAAWLHHRFVQIHPFADGNGRVARALTLIVLEKYKYAPLVIDRWHRGEYLVALDAANDGSLLQLTRLFVKLENAALTSELERPPVEPTTDFAVDVAHTLADQLTRIKKQRTSEIHRTLEARAVAVGGRIKAWFDLKTRTLKDLFKERKLVVKVQVSVADPGSDRRHWHHRQIVESAHAVGHFANFSLYQSWWRLRVITEGRQVDFIASMHGVGRDPGVVAVTTFGELRAVGVDEAVPPAPAEYILTARDAFYFVHTEKIAEIEARAGDLERILEEGLAHSLASLLKSI